MFTGMHAHINIHINSLAHSKTFFHFTFFSYKNIVLIKCTLLPGHLSQMQKGVQDSPNTSLFYNLSVKKSRGTLTSTPGVSQLVSKELRRLGHIYFMTLETGLVHSMESGPAYSVNTQWLDLSIDRVSLLCNNNQKATFVSWNSAGITQWLFPSHL